MAEKVLTISIAAYNVQDYIAECLNSFLQPAALDQCEVLIIDDGGIDRTAEIASEYEREYPDTFRVIHKENGGWGSTVNTGIQHATGKYFKQLDGDDRFSVDNLPTFLRALAETNSDLIVTPSISFVSGSKKIIGESNPAIAFGVEIFSELFVKELRADAPIAMHEGTVKTEILQKNGVRVSEKAFYTDVEFAAKIWCCSNTVTFLPMPVYLYRMMRAGQSVSMEGLRKHYKDFESVFIKTADYLNVHAQGHELARCYAKALLDGQYNSYTLLVPTREHMLECKRFDEFVKRQYPEYYNTSYYVARLLRKTNFLSYPLLCYCKALLWKLRASSVFSG